MKTLIILDNLFGDDELTLLNKKDLKYEPSLFDGVIDTEVRNSYQCNVKDKTVSDLIYCKVKDKVEITHINPCLRYIMYLPKGFMRLHYDENIKCDECYSTYTIMIYLNDADSDTIFIDDDFKEHHISAKKGRLVLFNQDIEHKTETLTYNCFARAMPPLPNE